MSFEVWLTLVLGGGIVGGIAVSCIQSSIVSGRKTDMEKKLTELDEFEATQKAIADDAKSGIAVDENKEKVCLMKYTGSGATVDVCSYRDLLTVEIFEDGKTITKTSRTSQIGGTLIGGLALGGVGAVIGGLSGKQSSSEKPSRIDLRITVNRTDSPIHDVNFMDTEVDKNSIIYTTSLEQARHWHGLISVLIRHADDEDKKSEETDDRPRMTTTNSVSDELKKLAQLKDEGVLTEEEFQTQKERLLGDS